MGQIVSWKFTKGSTFDEIKVLLECLHIRAQSQGNSIKTVFIDNCCQWRRNVQSVFGQECVVKLDVFHAVQLIVRNIPKRQPFHMTCCGELRLVFREKGDSGKSHTNNTLGHSEVLKNLENLSEKWKTIT